MENISFIIKFEQTSIFALRSHPTLTLFFFSHFLPLIPLLFPSISLSLSLSRSPFLSFSPAHPFSFEHAAASTAEPRTDCSHFARGLLIFEEIKRRFDEELLTMPCPGDDSLPAANQAAASKLSTGDKRFREFRIKNSSSPPGREDGSLLSEAQPR